MIPEPLYRILSLAPLAVVPVLKTYLITVRLRGMRLDGREEARWWAPFDAFNLSTYRPEAAPLVRSLGLWTRLQLLGGVAMFLGMLLWHLIDPMELPPKR